MNQKNNKIADFLNSVANSIRTFYGYHRMLLKTAERWLGNKTDAEDAVSDFYLYQLLNIEKYDSEIDGTKGIEEQNKRVRNYLYLPFYWFLVDCKRKRKVIQRAENKSLENRTQANGEIFGIEEKEQESRIKNIINNSLQQLPLIYRQVVEFNYFQKLSRFKIAEMLGIPAGTVASRLGKARKKLKEILTNYMPEREYVEFLSRRTAYVRF